jgi:hypothetical protein
VGGGGADSGAAPRGGRALGQRRVPDGPEEGQLLGAGQWSDLLGVQPGGAEQVEDGGCAALEGGEVLPEAVDGIGPPGGEVRGGFLRHRSRRGTQRAAEAVGAVGTQQQRADAVACGALCGGGGDGRTTAAARARDQDGAHEAER